VSVNRFLPSQASFFYEHAGALSLQHRGGLTDRLTGEHFTADQFSYPAFVTFDFPCGRTGPLFHGAVTVLTHLLFEFIRVDTDDVLPSLAISPKTDPGWPWGHVLAPPFPLRFFRPFFNRLA